MEAQTDSTDRKPEQITIHLSVEGWRYDLIHTLDELQSSYNDLMWEHVKVADYAMRGESFNYASVVQYTMGVGETKVAAASDRVYLLLWMVRDSAPTLFNSLMEVIGDLNYVARYFHRYGPDEESSALRNSLMAQLKQREWTERARTILQVIEDQVNAEAAVKRAKRAAENAQKEEEEQAEKRALAKAKREARKAARCAEMDNVQPDEA